jgi:hypothetical protein
VLDLLFNSAAETVAVAESPGVAATGSDHLVVPSALDGVLALDDARAVMYEALDYEALGNALDVVSAVLTVVGFLSLLTAMVRWWLSGE